MVLVVSNVGFFHHGFTPNTCDHYYLVTPVFKGTYSVSYAASALLTDRSDSDPNDGVASNPGYSVSHGFTAFVSSLMVSSRTYGISQRNPWVGWTLLVAYTLAAVVRSLRPRRDVSRSDLKQFQWFSCLYGRIRESGGLFPRRHYLTDIASFSFNDRCECSR